MLRHTPLAIVATLGFVTEASAADVFASDVMEIVPVGAVAGDGKTPVTVRIFARKADGSSLTGLKGKLLATEGTARSFQSAGDGWYSFEFTPPSTTQPVDVKLTVKAGSLSSMIEVPVYPAGKSSLSVRANPESLILGRADSATLSFAIQGDVPSAELEIVASSGEISDLTDMGGGTYSARYLPPSVNYPHLAVISVVAKDRPDLVGATVVRLQGAVDFPVSAEAGSSVVLKIADGDYGPVKMDAQGKGKVPIIVSPGINEARKIVVHDGARDESPFDLKIPQTRRIAFVPQPGGIPMDGGSHPVRVVVRKADGSPEGGAQLQLTVPQGDLSAVRHLGDGVYEADYTPSAAGDITFTADLPGTKKNQIELVVPVLPALPDRIGWDKLLSLPPSAGVATGVVLVPQARVLAADGSATTTLFVAAVDAFGYPVPGSKISLSASAGSVQGSITTNDRGVGTVVYTAPSEAGVVRVRAKAGKYSSNTGLVATTTPIDITWPRSAGLQGEWEVRLPTESSGGAVSVAALTPTPEPKSSTPEPAAASADVTALELELPESVAPGSKLQVIAIAKTGAGLGVPGKSLDFLTNTGTFGAVEDLGGGRYQAELAIPKKSSGELKISVVAPSGTMERATLSIDPGAVAPKQDPVVRKPKAEPADTPMVRARFGAVAGSYRYAQRPSDTPGPLLPGSLVVGGPDGGRAAPLGGIEGDIRAWFLPYVGARFGFRATGYSITADAFSNDAPDWLYHLRADLNARYPFEVGEDQFWIGATGGFQFDDFIVFKGCLEAGCEVNFEPITLPGLEIGAELGGEVGPVFFVGGLTRGFAFGNVGYRTGVDADVGLEVHDNVFVDLGMSVVTRRLPIEGETSGTPFGQIDDNQLVGRLSVGFQL